MKDPIFSKSKEDIELAHSREMSIIAKETVKASIHACDLYIQGSELACLRIANAYKDKETKVAYSDNLSTFYVAIYGLL